MRQLTSQSFEFHEPDEIAQAHVVESLVSVIQSSGKSGSETRVCAWAPDNSYFAWSSGHRILHLVPWNTQYKKRQDPNDSDGLSKRKYHIIDCSELIWSLAFGSGRDQKYISGYGGRFDPTLIIATGLANGKIRLWNCMEGTLIIELLDHRDTVRCLDFSKDGNLQLVSASRDGTLKLWDIPDGGNMYSTFKPPGVYFTGCRFSPNARFIAAVGNNRMVYLWRSPSISSAFSKLEGHHHEVASCEFSPDSALLATASFDTKVIVWSVHSLAKIRVLGHMHPSPSLIFAGGANGHYVRSVSFCPSGLTVATVCEDGYARFWRLDEQPDDPFAVADVPEATCGRMSPHGQVFAVGFRDGNVTMLSARQPVSSLMHLSRQVILKHLPTPNPESLPLPKLLLQYLTYCDLKYDLPRGPP